MSERKRGKVLVTGGDGQLGTELRLAVERWKNLGYRWVFGVRREGRLRDDEMFLDITAIEEKDLDGVDIVVNCAAWTDVDGAENHDNLQKVNGVNFRAVHRLGKICQEKGIFLIHISTDFVFPGAKRNVERWKEVPATLPINNYGRGKMFGELALGAANTNHMIIRTSWLYSPHCRNFVTAFCEKQCKGKEILSYDDRFSCLTEARGLAEFIMFLIEGDEENGFAKDSFAGRSHDIYHWCDEGIVSPYVIASTIWDFIDLEGKNMARAVPAPAVPEKGKALRPAWSVLECQHAWDDFKRRPRSWVDGLKTAVMLWQMKNLWNTSISVSGRNDGKIIL